MNTAKSAQEYLNDNDFEGAKYRFDNTTQRWKKHWFNICVEIMNKCKEWGEKYIIDPIAQTIVRAINKKLITKSTKVVPIDNDGKSCVYLIKLFADNKEHFLKCGKAPKNAVSRWKQIIGYPYQRPYSVTIDSIEPIKTWEFSTEGQAIDFETIVRNYLKTKLRHYPKDRFEPYTPTDNDIQEIDNLYQIELKKRVA